MRVGIDNVVRPAHPNISLAIRKPMSIITRNHSSSSSQIFKLSDSKGLEGLSSCSHGWLHSPWLYWNISRLSYQEEHKNVTVTYHNAHLMPPRLLSAQGRHSSKHIWCILCPHVDLHQVSSLRGMP